MKINYPYFFLLFIAVNYFGTFKSWAQPGTLDTSFNHWGVVAQDIVGKNDYGMATAIQPDGKILTAGLAFIDTVTYNDFVVTRHKANGQIDSSFGTNGYIFTDFSGGSDDNATSICIQPDGRIIVAGKSAITGSAYDFAMARYNTNGTLDNTFGTGGKVTTDISGFNDYGSCMKLQNDGKIVMAGYTFNGTTTALAVIRYNSNGTLDNSFDGDGIAIVQRGDVYLNGQSLAIQSDGKIVASATTRFPTNRYDILVTRLNTNGSRDNTFNGDGIVTTDFCYTDNAYAVEVQNDGKIIVVGSSNDTVNVPMGTNMMLIRYNTDGSIDSSFGINGKVNTEVTDQVDIAFALAIQKNGKIVTVGHSSDGVSKFLIILTRYNTDGSLDTTFSGDGKVITNLATEHEFGEAIALQADGKIVISGFINSGDNFNMFTARYIGDSVTEELSQPDIQLDKLHIYPNPVSNSLFIESPMELDGASISLVNMNGQKVREISNVQGKNYILNCQDVNDGLYVLSVSRNGLLISGQTIVVFKNQ